MSWKNVALRVARTFVQTVTGVWLAGQVAAPSMGDIANVGLLESATAAGIVSVVALVQNLVEEWRQVDYPRG